MEVILTVILAIQREYLIDRFMKNIQIIDGSANATFETSDEAFARFFPSKDQEIEFSEDFFEREGEKAQEIWYNRGTHWLKRKMCKEFMEHCFAGYLRDGNISNVRPGMKMNDSTALYF